MIPYVTIILLLLATVAIWTTREPRVFTEVKERYAKFREIVPPKYRVLRDHQVLLIGYLKKNKELGYNTNKGYEIGLCLDGTPNQVFHVLLHELAHSTVKEYDHNKEFWSNFKELRDIAASHGLYQAINGSEPFCGKFIKDA